MTNATTIIAINNFYNNCNGSELMDAIRLALNVRRDNSATSNDKWEAGLVIGAIQDIVVKRGGFDL